MRAAIRPGPAPAGTLTAPPSKSMAHRAVLCAALAAGTSRLTHLAHSQDIDATLGAAAAFGAAVRTGEDWAEIAGTGAFREYVFRLTCGSSGSFSTTGFFYINGSVGSSSAPVSWYVAYATCFDMTSSSDVATAQSTANTAQSTANAAKTAAASAAKTATNYLKFDTSGLCVGNQTSGTLGYNALVASTKIALRNGSTELATFGASLVELGKNSVTSKIRMCDGAVTFRANSSGGIVEGNRRLDLNAGTASVAVIGTTEDRFSLFGNTSLDISECPGIDIGEYVIKPEELAFLREMMFLSGYVNATAVNNNSTKDVVVKFDSVFGYTPTVVACLSGSSTAYQYGYISVGIVSVTDSQFTLRFYNAGAGNREPSARWIAIGRRY